MMGVWDWVALISVGAFFAIYLIGLLYVLILVFWKRGGYRIARWLFGIKINDD